MLFGRVGFYRDFAPTGLGVLLAVSGSTEMPPLQGLMYVGKRFEENRDGAPTALGLWDETV